MPLNKFIKVFLPHTLFAGVAIVALIAVTKQYDVDSSIVTAMGGAVTVSCFSNAIKSAYKMGIADAGGT